MILQGDCREQMRTLDAGSVQCCVTSPPYWGLRDYGVDGQLGLEPTPDAYVANMVEVFREVRRVLRDDGCVFLNIGDSFFGDSPARKASSEAFSKTWNPEDTASRGGLRRSARVNGLKPKDLCMIPARLALALQADGWWIRQDIIWAKGLSFCSSYSGSVMPESVTDRPTTSHEHVFLLTKNSRYFYDAHAVREKVATVHWKPATGANKNDAAVTLRSDGGRHGGGQLGDPSGRNLRSVWAINPQPFKEAHFATFPMALVEPCVKAGTSQKGQCRACGAPWVRIVNPSAEHAKRIKTFRTMRFDGVVIGQYIRAGLQRKGWTQRDLSQHFPSQSGGLTGCAHNWITGKNIPTSEQYRKIKALLNLGDKWDQLLQNPATGELQGWADQDVMNKGRRDAGDTVAGPTTTGWAPSCECNAGDPAPQVVLDPFLGSGTTGIVAQRLGREFVGIELSQKYCDMAADSIDGPLFAGGRR